MMACIDPVMKQEQSFVKALQATTSYRIVGETQREIRPIASSFRSSAPARTSATPAASTARK